MAETALDPFAVPFGFRDVPAGDAPPPPPPPEQEVAQAPVQETAPVAPAPPAAPPDERAVIPDLPPRDIPLGTQVQTQAGPTTAGLPGGLNFLERPDDED